MCTTNKKEFGNYDLSGGCIIKLSSLKLKGSIRVKSLEGDEGNSQFYVLWIVASTLVIGFEARPQLYDYS